MKLLSTLAGAALLFAMAYSAPNQGIFNRAACNEDNCLRAMQNPTATDVASSICTGQIQSTTTIPITTTLTATETDTFTPDPETDTEPATESDTATATAIITTIATAMATATVTPAVQTVVVTATATTTITVTSTAVISVSAVHKKRTVTTTTNPAVISASIASHVSSSCSNLPSRLSSACSCFMTPAIGVATVNSTVTTSVTTTTTITAPAGETTITATLATMTLTSTTTFTATETTTITTSTTLTPGQTSITETLATATATSTATISTTATYGPLPACATAPITNGGFETGNLTPWTFAGTSGSTDAVNNPGYSSNYKFQATVVSANEYYGQSNLFDVTLTQTANTCADGDVYIIDFFYMFTVVSGTPTYNAGVNVEINGNSLSYYPASAGEAGAWQQYIAVVDIATANATVTIIISNYDTASYVWGIDDVQMYKNGYNPITETGGL